jgi:hypothetical protein
MSEAGLSDEIDSCRFLFLRDLSESKKSGLRLLVEEADASPTERTAVLPGITLKVRPIVSDRASRSFELLWEDYVAYAVRNESCTAFDKEEVAVSGHLLRVYEKSHFLDYVDKATIAKGIHSAPLKHTNIVCLNHIVDVVALEFPVIKRVTARFQLGRSKLFAWLNRAD